jgi:hypothetical protein
MKDTHATIHPGHFGGTPGAIFNAREVSSDDARVRAPHEMQVLTAYRNKKFAKN